MRWVPCALQKLTDPRGSDYVLSDTSRKADYDVKRGTQSFGDYSDFFGADGDAEKEQESSANFFQNFFRHAQNAASGSAFGGAAAGAAGAAGGHEEETNENGQPEPNGVFGSVFEELLRPEVQRVAPLWTWVGSASGAGLGFIMGNIPGLIGGALLGNRMGAIRDAKGKSVVEVFVKLGAKEKADILRALAMKVLGSMGNTSR